jgi:hypothetical protein
LEEEELLQNCSIHGAFSALHTEGDGGNTFGMDHIRDEALASNIKDEVVDFIRPNLRFQEFHLAVIDLVGATYDGDNIALDDGHSEACAFIMDA